MSGTLLVAVTLLSSACGSGTPTATTTSIVKPPPTATGVCTFVLDGKIPSDEPQGLKPGFSSSGTDAAAVDALQSIRDHGGTGVVDSLTFPEETKLYAGPDTGQKSVGAVPDNQSIVVAEPVLWTDRSGGQWLAFFLACGGDSPYWVSLQEMIRDNPPIGHSMAAFIAKLRAAPPFDKTARSSLLPIKVNQHKLLVWADPKVIYVVGRGYLVNL